MSFDLDSIIRHGADWRLEIVLKIAENCNLACDYCYFYFRGNDSHSRHSALITEETVAAFLAFLRRVTTTTDFGLVQIDFHGGEPLLYPKERFDALCSGIRESVAGSADLILNVQTNGTLIDAEWVELFSKHHVIVGISLDGPAAVHDLHRFDKKGRGSHAATVRGLRLLQDAAAKGLLAQEPGVLCVYGFGTPIEELKRHFVDELGVRQFNILLDDATHDTWQRPEGFRADLFSAIAPREANGSGAMVPAIMRAEHQLQVRAFSEKLVAYDQTKNVIITVSSDGDISAADQVRVCGDEFCYDALNVRDADLRSILTSPGYAEQAKAYNAIPDGCRDCCWRNVCRGGELVHRFSTARGFNNPSIYCEVLQDLYASAAARLINGGRTVNQIERALGLPAEEMA